MKTEHNKPFEDIVDFTAHAKTIIQSRLAQYFGDNLTTDQPMHLKKSHADTFYACVMASIPPFLSDSIIAGYKIDLNNDIDTPGISNKERERFIYDLETCDDIVHFLVHTLNFKY